MHSRKSGRLSRLVLNLLRPYRGWLVIVFIAELLSGADILLSTCAS